MHRESISLQVNMTTNALQTVHPQPNHPISFKLYFSRAEAAEMLGLSRRTLDRLIAEKQLPVRRIGRRVLIHIDDIIRFTKHDHTIEVN